jgi:hypothetical protein
MAITVTKVEHTDKGLFDAALETAINTTLSIATIAAMDITIVYENGTFVAHIYT